MAKIYVITSGKGGTGKTTTAVNLGAALNKIEEDVMVVDANLTTPNLGLYFGAPIVPVSLNHLLQGKADIGEAVYEHESGTKIVPSSLSLKDLEKVDLNSLKTAIKQLKEFSDHILLDSAAGLGSEAKTAIQSADEAIVIVNPNILSVTDALKTIKFAQGHNKPVTGAIITRVKGTKAEMSITNIKEMLEVPILGIIPEDKNIEKALNQRDAIIHTKPRSRSAKAYQQIAEQLINKKPQSKSIYRRIIDAI